MIDGYGYTCGYCNKKFDHYDLLSLHESKHVFPSWVIRSLDMLSDGIDLSNPEKYKFVKYLLTYGFDYESTASLFRNIPGYNKKTAIHQIKLISESLEMDHGV